MGKRHSINERHRFARARARGRRDGTGCVGLNGSPQTPASADYSVLDLADTTRLALLVTARAQGDFRQQAAEVLEVMRAVLSERSEPAAVTLLTVFLRDGADQGEFERLLAEHYGRGGPVTNIVIQPPCSGAALAIEAWAISGGAVRLERFGSRTLVVAYDGMRWVYCGGIAAQGSTIYQQTTGGFRELEGLLREAGSGFENVVRTWLYLGGITGPEAGTSRYQEMNRARSDFYNGIQFGRSLRVGPGRHRAFPASTGIGTARPGGLVMSCMALETEREDVFLQPLENPQQVSAYEYEPKYSPHTPKFSRGMALVVGDYLTTWISGTASIVNSESRHAGNVEAQTEQTIDNIERLIAAENFSRHGIHGAGATLADLAKIRVYLKRPEDFLKCRAICERRFGPVPAIYVAADVCRSDLLVEIEGVAFSQCNRGE